MSNIVNNQVERYIRETLKDKEGLLKELEESEGKENEVTLDKIFEDIKWQKGFGFEYDTALEVLDELNYMGIIKLNKQLNPITLIINKSSEDLILQLYDDLI